MSLACSKGIQLVDIVGADREGGVGGPLELFLAPPGSAGFYDILFI